MIHKWIDSDGAATPTAMVLVGGVGTGKTAVANSVASLCHDADILASSFFFDRSVAGLDSRDLISTLVFDLASKFPQYASTVGSILEREPALASSPSAERQLRDLVIKPFAIRPPPHRAVIVIDALDAGATDGFVKALWELVPRLPHVMRIFVTTRPDPQLLPFKPHTRVEVFRVDIKGESNLRNVEIYSRHQLSYVAAQRELSGWPGAELESKFIEMAGASFLWVHSVTQFLANRYTSEPEVKLRAILEDRRAVFIGEQMDDLYYNILESFPDKDKDGHWVKLYHLVVGIVAAARIPLLPEAIECMIGLIVSTGIPLPSPATALSKTAPVPVNNVGSVVGHLTAAGSSIYKSLFGTVVATRALLLRKGVQFLQAIFGRIWISNGKNIMLSLTVQTQAHKGTEPCSIGHFLSCIGALLIAPDDFNAPVEFIHPSFVQFVTGRITISYPIHRFAIDQTAHSQRLAHVCLCVMVQEFSLHSLDIGFLQRNPEQMPGSSGTTIPCIRVSEAATYACRFWIDHLLDVNSSPSQELLSELRIFLSMYLATWLETLVSIDRFRPLTKIFSWFGVIDVH